jgi:hypothetical protein
MMIAGIGIVATMEETIVDVAERAAQTPETVTAIETETAGETKIIIAEENAR